MCVQLGVCNWVCAIGCVQLCVQLCVCNCVCNCLLNRFYHHFFVGFFLSNRIVLQCQPLPDPSTHRQLSTHLSTPRCCRRHPWTPPLPLMCGARRCWREGSNCFTSRQRPPCTTWWSREGGGTTGRLHGFGGCTSCTKRSSLWPKSKCTGRKTTNGTADW